MVKKKLPSIILFNHDLSTYQERNLEYLLQCKIISRTQLILNIFSQRAKTSEGKLQVKLAQLRYLNTRLTRGWSHLERQKGGIGLRGGPGETQLETDRRLLRKKINKVLLDLKKVENQREQSRRYRDKYDVSTISLIGYTNAGKSTLFNLITRSDVHVENKFFATLDPTLRRMNIKKLGNVVLIDTVGFIKNLPFNLISAFKATLQETTKSKLLLHVVDVSNKNFEQNINIVNHILDLIKVKNIPILLVMNKIDRLEYAMYPHIDRDKDGKAIRVWISSKEELGISLLIQVLNEKLSENMMKCELRIPINDSDLCKELYRFQIVEQFCSNDSNSVRIKICSSERIWNRLLKNHQSLLDYIV